MTLEGRELHAVPQGLVLRAEDERECRLGGLTPSEAVAQSVEGSLASYGVYVDGVLIALWGYAPSSCLGAGCSVWMLTTPESVKYPFLLARGSKQGLRLLFTLFPEVEALVDFHHVKAVAWLKWLGFKIVREEKGFATVKAQRPERFSPWAF